MNSMSVPTNIVIVINDDLAYGDLSRNGNPYTRTEHLDGLAQSSTRLDNYCSGPVCTPARAALLTGRHPYRTRAIDTYLGRSMIDPGEITLAHILQEQGYRTGLFGKWHLGDCFPMRPMDMGFDYSIMHRGGGLRQPGSLENGSYFDPHLEENGEPAAFSGYCTDVYFNKALDFISDSVATQKPFFTYVATNAPHSPFEVPESWVERFRQTDLPETWARLYGMVENIDWHVGRLLNHLEGLGQTHNTLVVFTSDHGPCGSARDDEGRTRFNADLRDIKGTLYEGGIRVPSIWSMPGTIPGGQQLDHLANPIDILPTIAGLTGSSVPDDRTIDGRNLWPLLDGSMSPDCWPDREICMQWHRGNEPVARRNFTVINQRYKLIQPLRADEPELYDRSVDPGESYDIAQDNPDLVASLLTTYDEWFADVSSEREDNYVPPSIVVGDKRSPVVVLTPQDWRLDPSTPDDWSLSTPGHWEIDVMDDGPCNIQAELPPEAAGSILTLNCGDWSKEIPLGRGLSNLQFISSFTIETGPISLPPGKHSFHATWNQPENPDMGVLQIKVSRVFE